MDVLQAIYGRRAIREYEPAAPSVEVITGLIADAVQAPNSINRQAWSFVVVQGRERLARYSREVKTAALQAMAGGTAAGLRGPLENPDFDIFYDAPALVIVCATSNEPMAAQDCCLAAQTLMLSAYAKGLGTCWIGFAEAWLNTAVAKRELGFPQSYVAVAPIIVGYPRSVPKPPGRRPPTITWIGDPALAGTLAAG